MTTQITVRLPDDLVREMDAAVADGTAKSRAAVVIAALKREHYRKLAERDGEIYAALEDDEFNSPEYLAWATKNAAKVWADLD